jgi:mannose-1-phosphate guanylyltransferase/mannose-6-phosphate isomerase
MHHSGGPMIPVIMSGGSGTRLWPVSRSKFPKQFCELFEESLFNLTLKRASQLGSPWVVTSKALRDLTLMSLRQNSMNEAQAIFEPQAKNTAPAIAYLVSLMMKKGLGNEVVVILPADHLIEKEDQFKKVLSLAEKEAHKGFVVTLGIKPSYPETGYGYIETNPKASTSEQGLDSFSVEKFHEKPNLENANVFLKNKNYHWNAGIFVFKIEVMAKLLETHQPEMWKNSVQVQADQANIEGIFEHYRSISIDYAIMEKLDGKSLKCIPCDIDWSDVGSWDAVSKILENTQSPAKKIEVKSENNYIHPIKDKTYAMVDVNDLIVVDTKDALLISKKGSSQDVKDVVDKLKITNPHVSQEHVFENRPWGRFEVLRDEGHYKSKVIHVLPKAQISYQSHAKREEHWFITRGDGEVVLNDQIIAVTSGTYVKIPLGAKHRIRNTGEETIEFIEVQMGTYFGEDDIVRYQDDYKRH